MEKQERSAIDMLLDEECTENIVMYDDKDQETEFEQIAIIPFNEKVYAILRPIKPELELEEDEAFVFCIEEIDDEDCLLLVDNDKEINDVFAEYYRLLKNEGLI